MSANIGSMIYVGETPWHGLGVHYDAPPKSSEEIIAGAKLDWTVSAIPVKTDLHDHVHNYHAVYREDTNDIFGLVKAARPRLVQNAESFKALDSLIDSQIDVETAASLGGGETIFGCFKIRDQYKVLDDEIDHYYVVVNDHLKVDGKVTVLNTPVRVVCQNTLSHALHKNFYKIRIPIVSDDGANLEIANRVFNSAGDSVRNLQKRAEKMVAAKVDREYVEKVLDQLFPYATIGSDIEYSKANEAVSMMRETFLTECMGADNLGNYRGTVYQIFNALTDYTQHYYKSVDKVYDLNHRMKLLPGIGLESEPNKVAKFLEMSRDLIA